MIRTPLRPLARILDARAKGQNPDAIEKENLRIRHEQMRDSLRVRAEGRLLVLAMLFLCAFGVVGTRMGMLSASETEEPRRAVGSSIIAARADIVDRQGRVLATNMSTYSLYIQPRLTPFVDPAGSAQKLAAIFPDLDAKKLTEQFGPRGSFRFLKKKLSPEQMQAVHDIGEPGLLFGPREMRLYPNGKLASHVLGGAAFGAEGVSSAEVIGTAGVELFFDKQLRDPANAGAPLELSIDLGIQAVTEEVLGAGMTLLNAKGAAAILMDIKTGELVALASLPDFDPNDRPPAPRTLAEQDDSPIFNRAAQGSYELGSTFKIFAAAEAMQLGLVTPQTQIDTSPPFRVGGFSIGEFDRHNYGIQTVEGIIIKSSNRGTGKMALMIGIERQKEFLKRLGFFTPTTLELPEARQAKPQLPNPWTELSSVTISYGHGLAASPLHLASGYAAIANGGYKVEPTLVKQSGPRLGEQVLRPDVAAAARTMLHKVVTEGTASMARVEGYDVGGKTGTADKPNPQGGYYDDKVVNTFASIFPIENPAYVLIVTLDEPVETSGSKPRRTAGWTAVPVAAEMIARIAPLLGLRPNYDKGQVESVVKASH